MNVSLKPLALVAAMGLGLFAASDAAADTRLTCDMSGTWYPDKDSFAFVASYVSKNGPDTFTGVYTNTSAGAVANVNGVATKGTWIINLTYTDAKHRGYVKDLVGTGTRSKSNLLTIKGDFTAKRNGSTVQRGTFTINGRCR